MRQEKIYEGDADGVIIVNDEINNRFIVDLPNAYDVYWGFTGKVDGQDYANRIAYDDPKRVVFEVPYDRLDTQQQIQTFNIKVNKARETSREIIAEKVSFEDVLAFDEAKEGKTVAFLFKNPARGFCVGETLKAGKYFVAQSSGESDDKVFVRLIHTSRLLSGKEEFANRIESVQEKFPIGSVKYLRFDDFGRITVRDYQPKQEPANQAQKPVDQAQAPVQEPVAMPVKADVKPEPVKAGAPAPKVEPTPETKTKPKATPKPKAKAVDDKEKLAKELADEQAKATKAKPEKQSKVAKLKK